MSGPGRADEAHPSLGSAAHEEEPRNAMDVADDLLNHLTATQLLYTLHRVHHLCYHAPDKAKELLNEDPNLSLALIHAHYLLGVTTGERLLPLTADEVSLAKDRLQQIRTQGAVAASESAVQPMPFYAQQSAGALPATTPEAPTDNKLDHLAREISALTASKVAADTESIMVALGNLSPEQIASLPEEVQAQVLELLQGTE
ncbi:hypothetical protein Pmar_PMAR023747 [Perkinsus marinus ATCC 50983]|uniref:Cleavage stimulation factor subunit 2 hinge domain-containing protein n=1 Tax=Perkinsus marinus (strain ATCC 50983 / TXsc) TaxID=423536 RepID=C5KCF5_PERM5|nr:hypothetical protein Pmar_PMAR023747 [Perkinsus marinus ATCC 50983]EER17817.1 hypothetical protein Pmar_PMAR023747 [Perkinsus marinus ATCC 50983]|eukprot:XP_002786021.1 hypothetical protein Pmar_PMAR023747 [Perkinsus marinus ATCC 50983]